MSKKPAAAPPIEQKKEKPKKELDPALLERLKQLNPSDLHSSTPLQHIINTLVKREYCSIASLQLAIKNNRLKQWFPNAEVTWDAIKELVPESGSMTAQSSAASGPSPVQPSADYPPISQGDAWAMKDHARPHEVSGEGDGASLWDPNTFLQERVCSQLCEAYARNRAAAFIFRAPPQSGKTTLAGLLAYYISRTRKGVRLYLVQGHRHDQRVLTWRVAERIWVFEEPQKTVLDVIAEPNDAYNHLVIVDEAQNLYTCSPEEVQGCHSWVSAPYPLSLWARIKEVSSLQVAYKVRFLVLAAYGTHGCLGSPVTPVRFRVHATVLLPSTFLNRSEVQTFLDTYGRTHRRVSLPPVVRKMLWRLTRGHIPYLARLLNSLQMRLSETQENLSFMTAFQTLTTTELVQGGSLDIAWTAVNKHECVLKHLLWRDSLSDSVLFSRLNEEGICNGEDRLYELEKNGVIVRADKTSAIPIPLLRWHWAGKMFPISSESYKTPFDLLIAVLRRMDRRILISTFSRKDRDFSEPAYEAVWQYEFYRCLYECRPGVLSPEFGAGKALKDGDDDGGNSGYVDFFINGKLKWAFELLREGSGISEHIHRFEAGGCYETLVSDGLIADWLVIDFRNKNKAIKKRHPRLVHVRYNSLQTMTALEVEWCKRRETIDLLRPPGASTVAAGPVDPNDSVTDLDEDTRKLPAARTSGSDSLSAQLAVLSLSPAVPAGAGSPARARCAQCGTGAKAITCRFCSEVYCSWECRELHACSKM